MQAERITDRALADLVEALTDPDVIDGFWEDEMAAELEPVLDLLVQIERELDAQGSTERERVRHSYTDPSSARRATRRGERAVLRHLPRRLAGGQVEFEGGVAA
ncbi:hypothetical protein D5S17_14515 [Pseudonocardiaceae bacterium YIM PH 21723]|nr:hypothetical protein D5S17_14515 [Pseudonocardiaceae bacterium YIM PH 21723]